MLDDDDTRSRRARAFAAGYRDVLDEFAEHIKNDNLEAARMLLDGSVKHLKIFLEDS